MRASSDLILCLHANDCGVLARRLAGNISERSTPLVLEVVCRQPTTDWGRVRTVGTGHAGSHLLQKRRFSVGAGYLSASKQWRLGSLAALPLFSSLLCHPCLVGDVECFRHCERDGRYLGRVGELENLHSQNFVDLGLVNEKEEFFLGGRGAAIRHKINGIVVDDISAWVLHAQPSGLDSQSDLGAARFLCLLQSVRDCSLDFGAVVFVLRLHRANVVGVEWDPLLERIFLLRLHHSVAANTPFGEWAVPYKFFKFLCHCDGRILLNEWEGQLKQSLTSPTPLLDWNTVYVQVRFPLYYIGILPIVLIRILFSAYD